MTYIAPLPYAYWPQDYSRNIVMARSMGDMATAIEWRRREWGVGDPQGDAAEREERKWWSVNKPEVALPTETNPKAARAVADGKAPLQYLEPAANEPTARVLEHGADKYGYRNWRVNEINLRTYLGATQRHIDAMKNGEWLDPDSGEPHFAHVSANAHVVLDAKASGTLHDDTLKVESK